MPSIQRCLRVFGGGLTGVGAALVYLLLLEINHDDHKGVLFLCAPGFIFGSVVSAYFRSWYRLLAVLVFTILWPAAFMGGVFLCFALESLSIGGAFIGAASGFLAIVLSRVFGRATTFGLAIIVVLVTAFSGAVFCIAMDSSPVPWHVASMAIWQGAVASAIAAADSD